MDYRAGQEQQSLNPRDYKTVIVVCGSRHWNDKKTFHQKLVKFLENYNKPVLFVSGAAPSGADNFIIAWCLRYGFPCRQVPADWDRLGNSAGYVRNEKMAQMATDVLGFYNGKSKGTRHMLQISTKLKKAVHVVGIEGFTAMDLDLKTPFDYDEEDLSEPSVDDYV